MNARVLFISLMADFDPLPSSVGTVSVEHYQP